MISKHSIRLGAGFALGMAVATANAQIYVTQYAKNEAGGGANIQANWVRPATFCCAESDMRWFQVIELRDGAGALKNNVPGYPNGRFVDPQPNQPPGGWDNLPWYDVTYGSAADRTANTNMISNGSGRFMNDSPQGWKPFGPMSFNATTLVVCIDQQNKKFRYIGGFTWGFTVAAPPANPAISLHALTQVNDSAALRNLCNSALGSADPNSEMRQWSMIENTACTLGVVPEPASLAALGLGSAAFIRRRRRK